MNNLLVATKEVAIKGNELQELRNDLVRLYGDPAKHPDASIVIPVNAQGDIGNLLLLLSDIANYHGNNNFEIVPVINNYPEDNPPEEIELLRRAELNVVSVPNARRPGEKVGFSARMPGLNAARSNFTIHFDADCRIPNSTALLDYYVEQLRSGVLLVYSPVLYYDLPKGLPVKVRVAVHNIVRWTKRNILGIPTARGSNYAIERRLMRSLYKTGKLTEDFQIGPNIKAIGAKHAYSGNKELAVLTSGRNISGSWKRLFTYVRWRFFFNLKLLRDTAAARSVKETRTE